MKPETKAANSGTVGGALGILVVLFMPASVFVFDATTAAVATAAFGIIFSYGMQFAPKPKKKK